MLSQLSTLATNAAVKLNEKTGQTLALPLLIFFPTARCNSRCVSCDWWRADGASDLTKDEWVSEAWLSFSRRHSAQVTWLREHLRQDIRNFERVLNSYYPTTTDARLSGVWREVLRGMSAWRYNLRVYEPPIELRVLERLVRYQRPEASGF